jgi:hypothetical protein
MIRRNGFLLVALVPVVMTSAFAMGCSSDDSASSSPTYTPFDSGTVIVPEAGPGPSRVTIQVQGEGTVRSSDAHLVDGGEVGKVTCAAEAPASECLAPQYSTLYAVASPNWVLSRWTTTGLADTVDLAAGNPSITIAATTPSPLIAVFVPEGQTGTTPPASSDDAGAAHD